MVTLYAFIFSVLTPFFATYNTAAAANVDAKEMSSLFGDKVLICSSGGFKFVTWEELAAGKHHDENQEFKCPLCYVAVHGVKANSLSNVIALAKPLSDAADTTIFRDVDSLKANALAYQRLSRAPPSPVSA